MLKRPVKEKERPPCMLVEDQLAPQSLKVLLKRDSTLHRGMRLPNADQSK